MDNSVKKQIERIEKSPGVYVFRNRKNKILYIGKAKNLRARVRSYFVGGRDGRPLIPKIINETTEIKTIQTDSEVEAILLEAKLIKKIKPPYNARQKDDKSFIYIFIDFSNPIPKVQFVRQREVLHSVIPVPCHSCESRNPRDKLQRESIYRFRIKSGMTIRQKDKLFGPFLSAVEIRKLLNYFRLIIPFRDCPETKFKKYKKINRGCQWSEINKCSAPCCCQEAAGYRRNIYKLSRLLSGKINRVKKELLREMKANAKKKKFERAAEIRDRIKTLEHIKEVSLLEDDWAEDLNQYLIAEGVDISNISGVYAVGSVVRAKVSARGGSAFGGKSQKLEVVFNKSGYRRFKIRTKSEPDDVGMMREVIKRRLNHPEWKFPDLLIIDGGRGQLNAVNDELGIMNQEIPIIAIAKGPKRKGEKLFFSRNFDSKLKSTLIKDKRVIKLMRDEAHRFAINYHKLLRKKGIVGI